MNGASLKQCVLDTPMKKFIGILQTIEYLIFFLNVPKFYVNKHMKALRIDRIYKLGLYETVCFKYTNENIHWQLLNNGLNYTVLNHPKFTRKFK